MPVSTRRLYKYISTLVIYYIAPTLEIPIRGLYETIWRRLSLMIRFHATSTENTGTILSSSPILAAGTPSRYYCEAFRAFLVGFALLPRARRAFYHL